ncbi:hypothetical protein MBAV_003494 [Candidatus Magnetobacterium bavaricum]|uniref:Uncharacterized protein n=1 Tax=Candidatus Magnetobacterium bavaricum TaxID=29290 RepID=A0A0F3GQS6_9BACT|nr:hypothetical protein MBAV_003494 [Candidatus Magnetobacterium bavaricum]
MFKDFAKEEELHSYEMSLGGSSYQLLRGGDDVDLIRDGELKNILLHELGDNAFVHGEGVNVRFAVSEYPKRDKVKDHEILASFGGRAYIEVVVSDSGKGLLKKLTSCVPEDYIPTDADIKISLSKDVKTVLYAFEFSSTSNEERRKDKIAEILTKAKEYAYAIPTGLFHVASLCKRYGGQVIVRTGNVLASIDYSRDILPLINGKSNIALVKGTHVLVRVPRNLDKKIERVERRKPTTDYVPKKLLSILLGDISKLSATSSEFIVKVEKKIEEVTVECKKKDILQVAILCDGLQVDTKTFSLLLVILSMMPRQDFALILFGVRSELMSGALKQWEFIQNKQQTSPNEGIRLQDYRSFILCSDDFSQTIEFGDTTLPDSTVITDKPRDGNYLKLDMESLFDLYIHALKNELIRLIERPPVKYPNAYYLIEGKYYAQTYYEIRKLFSPQIGKDMSCNYFLQLLFKRKIGTVFVITESLYEFTDYMIEKTKNIKWYKKIKEKELSSFIDAFNSRDKNREFLILTDVVSTARGVKSFLSFIPDSDIDNIKVFCFLDARVEDYKYIPVERKDKPYQVSVLSILKKPINPIAELPSGIDYSKVLIIDKRTLAPTSYDNVKTPSIPFDELVRMAIESRAIFPGHILYKGKHYNYFLYLARLFLNNRGKLEELLNIILTNDYLKRKIENKDITVFYLDEQKGWENLIADYMSTKGIAKCEAITFDQLEAPPQPLPKTPNNKLNAILFIIPAIITGETARLCLEYAHRFKPSDIYISILVARMDSTLLSFYRKIRGYGDCKNDCEDVYDCKNVLIEILSMFPITAYTSKNSCPMCEAEKIILDVQRKVKEFEYLSEIVNKHAKLFTRQEITLGDLDKGIVTPLSDEDREKVIMRGYYEEATRNLEQRKKLNTMLDDVKGQKAFIEMVGEEFMSLSFTADEVEIITYSRYKNIEKTAFLLIQNIDKEKISIKMLLGIYRLFPEMLSNNFKVMFSSAIEKNNKEMCEDLIFLALLDSDGYLFTNLEKLTDIKNIGDNSWGKELINQTKAFFNPKNRNYDRTPVEDFMELLWLLRRSTPWGTNIEKFRLRIQINDHDFSSIEKSFNSLESEGINRVLSFVELLKKTNKPKGIDSLWDAIKIETTDIDESVKGIKNTSLTMKKLIEKKSTQELLDKLEELDKYGNKLKEGLENLFVNPISVKMKLEDIKASKWPTSNLDIRFNVKPDQPGLLFTLDNLETCLILVIDNAVEFISKNNNSPDLFSDNPWIEFDFAGYTEDKLASIMYVRDNIRWNNKIKPTGGMRQFAKYCEKYAAKWIFNPETEDEYLKIQVTYKIDITMRNRVE